MSGLQNNAQRCKVSVMLDKVNDAVAAELRAATARRNLSGAAAARQSGLPVMYTHRRLNGLVEISVSDFVTICAGIGAYPLDVLAQALTAPTSPPAPADDLSPDDAALDERPAATGT